MTAPAMATGVPKPDVPSMIAPNENAISTHLQAPVERDVGDRLLDDLELPGDDGHRVQEHRADDDPDDSEKSRQRPERERRERRRPTGMRNTRQRDQERGDDAGERGARARRCPGVALPLASRLRVQRDEVQQRQDRHRRQQRRQHHAPRAGCSSGRTCALLLKGWVRLQRPAPGGLAHRSIRPEIRLPTETWPGDQGGMSHAGPADGNPQIEVSQGPWLIAPFR